MSAAPGPRILVLHGFRMTGSMMEEMMAGVVDVLSDLAASWEFVDAANPATGEPLPFVASRWPGLPVFEHWNATDRDDGSVEYVGFPACLARVRALVDAAGGYDLVVGYSQGAAAATVLTALLEGRQPAPWRGAVLLNAGLPPRDPALAAEVEAARLDLPSIHVLGGERDFARPFSEMMAERWAPDERVVLEHDEGHTPPSRRRSPETLEALRRAVGSLLAEAGGEHA